LEEVTANSLTQHQFDINKSTWKTVSEHEMKVKWISWRHLCAIWEAMSADLYFEFGCH
jgi:hypothetical protein